MGRSHLDAPRRSYLGRLLCYSNTYKDFKDFRNFKDFKDRRNVKDVKDFRNLKDFKDFRVWVQGLEMFIGTLT